MKAVDRDGKSLNDIELRQQAGDNVFLRLTRDRAARLATQVYGTFPRSNCTNQERHRTSTELGIVRFISSPPETLPRTRFARLGLQSLCPAISGDVLTRLYRKSPSWSRSSLLFLGPNGAPLSRAALHNALRRLNLAGGLRDRPGRKRLLAPVSPPPWFWRHPLFGGDRGRPGARPCVPRKVSLPLLMGAV